MLFEKIKRLWILSWPAISIIFPKVTARWALTIFLTPQRIARPASESEFFKTARKYKIRNRIAAFEWGLSENPLIVLVHGWSGRGTQMAAFADPLVQIGFRVIAVDGPAHGDSYGVTTHVGEYSEFLIDLQKDLGPYRAIIAHSFGAGCSVLSAARGLSVEKLVLIASPSHYEVVARHFLTAINIGKRSQDYFIETLSKKVNLPVSEMNVGAIGNSLSVRALIVHDKGDKEVSFYSAEEIKKNWLNADLLATSGLGHRRILKDPEVIKQIVAFLSKK